MLLDSGEPGFEALIAPGHVATVMGPEEWEFVPREHDMPDGGRRLLRRSRCWRRCIRCCARSSTASASSTTATREVVRPGGNPAAQRFIDQTMDVVAGNWRGIGAIPESGYVLKAAYAAHDSRVQLPSYTEMARKRAGEMPPGCDCARVVLGKIYPNECRLYGLACTPRQPVGPVHGLGRRRMPHLVGERRARKRLDRAQGVRHRGVTARRIVMTGRVQGVGYRPFVYRLAHEHALAGYVRNLRGDVEVVVTGTASVLDAFERELVERAPPLAQPRVRGVAPCEPAGRTRLPHRAEQRGRRSGGLGPARFLRLRRVRGGTGRSRPTAATPIRSSTARSAARATR